jgi:hypothetical protein
MSFKQSSLGSWRIPMTNTANNSQQTSSLNSKSTNLPSNQDSNQQQSHKPTPHLVQQSFDSQKQHKDIYWGHQIPIKKEGTLRLGLRNVNSLPINKSHSKNAALINDINEGQFDILCATEINLAWKNISADDALKE